MCGIIGEVNADGVDVDLFVEMRDELAHRGPDGTGLYTQGDTVALGHRRLSIIDLTPAGDQPMSNEEGTVWLTYNGEIYNFVELREELVELGHDFASDTDSEVIVHGYEEWGTDCVERFRGMFAFGIWDEERERLFLARDRLGIKPLYYYDAGDRFVFASELKAIVADGSVPREVDPVGLKHFLMYRYVPCPYSIWEGIRKLPPGSHLVYEDGEATVASYWSVDDHVGEESPSESAAIDAIEDVVRDAVAAYQVSDVPLGVLLSGGVDSSLVTAISAEHNPDLTAFSMGFDSDRFDELTYARLVAEDNGVDLVEDVIDGSDLQELLDDILYVYDEPLGDSSIFPTYLLTSGASEELKTVLSGDGGDEVFAGYDWYARWALYERFGQVDWLLAASYRFLDAIPGGDANRYVRGVKHRLEPFTADGFGRYRRIRARRFEPDEVEALFGERLDTGELDADIVEAEWPSDPDVKDLQALDVRTHMTDDILVKVDRASMAHSLEVRVPLLDHNVVETAFSMDESLLFEDSRQKHLLKQVAARYLPDRVVNQEKRGFSAPLGELGFIEENLDVLFDSRAAGDGVLDGEALREFAARDLTHLTATELAKRWLLVLFELWYREWRPSTTGPAE